MAKLDYFRHGIKALSYSRRGMLHQCARKYELTTSFSLANRENSVTFAFGHAVAMGIQVTIAGASLNQAIMACYLEYDHDLFDKGTKSEQKNKKSVHYAVLFTELFWKKYNAGAYPYLKGWELAKFVDAEGNERDGIEMTYLLEIVDGFSDEGHIDLVLYHPVKKRYMVVEIKTTGSNNIHPAQYKYSDQPLGYGIVLDALASRTGAQSSFDILYLVYKTRSMELVPMPFSKTIRDRARWLQELLMDVELIQKYEEEGHYPHNGASCYDYFRPCQHFDVCKMTSSTLRALSQQNLESKEDVGDFAQMEKPDFVFTIEELLERQDQLVAEIEAGKSESEQKDSVDLLLASLEVTN